MSVVVMNEKVEKVEKVMKVKNVKLGVKYERMYMCLYTVLNRFCVSSSVEEGGSMEEGGGFVLNKCDMRKILDSVEFYNEDVVVQGEYMDMNILNKENMKKVRKNMKQERINMKKGILEEEVVKKVRKNRKSKVVVEMDMVVEPSVEHTPKMKKTSKKNLKKEIEKTSKKEVEMNIDMEKVEIEVGKVVVVIEKVDGRDLVEREGEGFGGRDLVEGDIEKVGGRDLMDGRNMMDGRDLVEGFGGRDLVEGEGEGFGGNMKKVGKKAVKKPKKKSEMVEDISV